MFSRRSMMVALALGGCLLFSAPAMATGRGAVGSFTTPTVSGTVKFVAVKRVVQWNGYRGNMVISGRTDPGIMYGLRDGSGRVAFVWYYASDYAQAGRAILSLTPDGSSVGPIDFMNHKGVITNSGSMTVQIVF
jgi:hypothetical protein